MKPDLAANVRRILWSDVLGIAAKILLAAGARLYEESIETAVRAREERSAWWRAGWTYENGRLIRKEAA